MVAGKLICRRRGALSDDERGERELDLTSPQVRADVIAAANTAAEVVLRIFRHGEKDNDVTEAVQKVAPAYDCKSVEGVLSHQMEQALEETGTFSIRRMFNHDLLQPYHVLHVKPGKKGDKAESDDPGPMDVATNCICFSGFFFADKMNILINLFVSHGKVNMPESWSSVLISCAQKLPDPVLSSQKKSDPYSVRIPSNRVPDPINTMKIGYPVVYH
ncbi:hypothetical protein ACH5RR_005007 [Cinchona calisaya]|uniref:Uncharacterized protein n=1 Tax=Cinchona calisaya TaxID=153742 RepID=A0ABD3AZC7_9GENT